LRGINVKTVGTGIPVNKTLPGVRLRRTGGKRSLFSRNQKEEILDKGDERPAEEKFGGETNDAKENDDHEENEENAADLRHSSFTPWRIGVSQS
jgi:hypothetical protein